jgi:hypothetical protein
MTEEENKMLAKSIGQFKELLEAGVDNAEIDKIASIHPLYETALNLARASKSIEDGTAILIDADDFFKELGIDLSEIKEEE